MVQKHIYIKRSLFLIVTAFAVVSCDNLFEYSPYKAGVRTPDKDLNIKAIREIENLNSSGFRPFTIGLVGDSHTYYDYYEKQVAHLNKKDDLDFVVHLGDITLSGIYREFIWYKEISSKLKHPLITIIGNHDYLSNGEFLYKEMFGPYNFTIVHNNCLLVFLDNVIWEKNVQDPDFEWLEEVLKDSEEYTYRLVFSHIPPWSDQFNTGNEFYFNMLMEKYNVDFSIHGHTHHFWQGRPYKNGPPYLTISSSQKGEVFFLDVKADTLQVRREHY